MTKTPTTEFLQNSSLGRELDDDECRILAGIMGVRDLDNGEVLVNEGERNSALYVLAAGRLAVSSRLDGNEVTVYHLKAGEVAGTRAFVDREPRRATLKSVGASTVYTLDSADFDKLVDSHPRIGYEVMRGLFRITHINLMRMNLESQQLAHYIAKTGGRY